MNRPEERRIKTTKSEIETLRSDFDDQLPTIRNRENPQELFVKKETSLGSRFKKAEKFVAKKSGTLKESIQRPLTGLFRKNVEDRRSMVNRTAVEEGNVDVVHAFSDDIDDVDEKAEIARLENEESLRKIDQIINKMLGNAHEESPKNSNFNEPLQFDALQKDFGENIMVGDIDLSRLCHGFYLEEELEEETAPWSWDYLYANIYSDTGNDNAPEETDDADLLQNSLFFPNGA